MAFSPLEFLGKSALATMRLILIAPGPLPLNMSKSTLHTPVDAQLQSLIVVDPDDTCAWV